MGRERFRVSRSAGKTRRQALTARPHSVDDIVAVLTDRKSFPSPLRPVGAGSGNPRGTSAPDGTRLDMTAMNRVLELKDNKVTVQAGMRVRDLARLLASRDLELLGSFEQPDRSIGGMISGGCLSAGLAKDAPFLSASVCDLQLVTPEGRRVELAATDTEMLALLRQSYGLLGVIHAVTLRVRRARTYAIRHRKMDSAEFARIFPGILTAPAGIKLYLLPFRDRVFVELRDQARAGHTRRTLGWRLSDWLANRLLPQAVRCVNRAFSIGRIRDPLIDRFSETTQIVANTRLTDAGSNVMEQTSKFRRVGSASPILSCTWFLPAENFCEAWSAYRKVCIEHRAELGYRCDLPAIAYRIRQDPSAVLSPSFNGEVIALDVRSTSPGGWDDFLLQLAETMAAFGGIPAFNQTRGCTGAMTAAAFGPRIARFDRLRRRADSNNRLLNAYFAGQLNGQ